MLGGHRPIWGGRSDQVVITSSGRKRAGSLSRSGSLIAQVSVLFRFYRCRDLQSRRGEAVAPRLFLSSSGEVFLDTTEKRMFWHSNSAGTLRVPASPRSAAASQIVLKAFYPGLDFKRLHFRPCPQIPNGLAGLTHVAPQIQGGNFEAYLIAILAINDG